MAAFERILVTGGAGFVGGHLCAALAEAYPQATRSLLLRPGERGGHEAFAAAVADLVDEAAIDALIARVRPDLVVHLAGQSSIGAGAARRRNDLAGEFSRLLRARGGGRPALRRRRSFLFASTRGRLWRELSRRRLERGRPAAAAGRLQPLQGRRRERASPICWLPKRRGSSWRGRSIIPDPASAIAISRSPPSPRRSRRSRPAAPSRDSWSAISPRPRDFLDVRDVVDAYMRLIEKARDLPASVSIFNIASGTAHRLEALLERLRGRAQGAI